MGPHWLGPWALVECIQHFAVELPLKVRKMPSLACAWSERHFDPSKLDAAFLLTIGSFLLTMRKRV